MKVSIDWLKQLVDLKVPFEELITLLPMRVIGIKETSGDFIELDMKGYNRADLLSMRGVAREVAAITGSNVTFQDEKVPEFDLPKTRIEVEDKKLCPIYCIAKIEGLKSGPSNKEWVKKLTDSGMRAVNNIADITNLIMLEYGQPLHAFDTNQVKNETIIVRSATQGETLQTLDSKTRKLESGDLLITNPEKILGLAGIMGGKDSEISDATTTILLEAAIFDPVTIRRSAQRMRLNSEASKRFQHGLTKTNLVQALSAAIKMYEELGGKLTAISMVGDLEDGVKKVTLTQKKVNDLIGVDISAEEVEKHLQSLGFNLHSHMESKQSLRPDGLGNVFWDITVPYWRLDINIEEDLVEEVARMYGYEKIPAKPLQGKLPEKIDQQLYDSIYNTKKALADIGLTEVQTYSFYSTQVLAALGFNDTNKDAIVRVANPISSETEYLREYIWPNLVEVIEKNIRQGYKDIAIFEIGKVYFPSSASLRAKRSNLPKESYRLAIALMNGSDNPAEELIALATQAWPGSVKLEKGNLMKELETFFHPTRFATLKTDKRVLGSLTEVHPRFLNNFGINKRVAILEIDLEKIIF